MGNGVEIMGMDEIREIKRIKKEEERSIVEKKIKIELLSVEFEGKEEKVKLGIGREKIEGKGGKEGKNRSMRKRMKKIGFGIYGNIESDGKSEVRKKEIGMKRKLGNEIKVMVREILNKMIIMNKDGKEI